MLKIITVQIYLYQLTYKILLNDHSENILVTSIDTFLLRVDQDNMRKFMEIIYNITYKYFDDNELWSLDLEKKYMEIFKF